MNDLPARHILKGDVVTDDDRVTILFERGDVEDMLRRFASGDSVSDDDSRRTSEDDLDRVLTDYSVELASLAFQGGSIDVDLVRNGFDRVQDCMNEIGNEMFGTERPRTMTQAILEKAGLRAPAQRRYFAPLDDRYWEVQFMEQYDKQTWTQRRPGQTDASYFAHYTATAMHHFLLAPYSYIQ